MNQKDNKATNISNNKKAISIPLVPLIIIAIAIIILKMYLTTLKVNAVSDNISNESNNTIISSQEESNIISNDEQLEREDTDSIDNNIEEPEEPSTQNVITYTASNGETYNIIGTLNIPTLGIEYPILSSTSDALLKVSINKYWGANPNEVGNMVVIGHNYKNSKFFGKLPNIKIGDIVKITDTKGKTLDYSVYETDVIDPYDNSCTSQLTDGRTEITLITCFYENGSAHATKRFIVKARTDK